MNVYVETNFLLELVFEQEQCASCEQVLDLVDAGRAKLVIPAYCLAEPLEKLRRLAGSRRELQEKLDAELRQLSRSASYTVRLQSSQEISQLLADRNKEEKQRFATYRDKLLRLAEIIPLDATILTAAASSQTALNLTGQDAIVYAAVMSHLRNDHAEPSCFLNRNKRDFDKSSIVDELKNYQCTMISRFDHGFSYIQQEDCKVALPELFGCGGRIVAASDWRGGGFQGDFRTEVSHGCFEVASGGVCSSSRSTSAARRATSQRRNPGAGLLRIACAHP